MKKHYILLSLKAPDFSTGVAKPQEWGKNLTELTDRAKSESGVILLAENDFEVAFLIPRDEAGLSFTAEYISRAENCDGIFQSWFLDGES